jgi:hypothetical protein
MPHAASTLAWRRFALAVGGGIHDHPRPVVSFVRHLPLAVRLLGPCCALATLGCKPLEVVQPVVPVQAAPQQLFAAPPLASAPGMVVDPFAVDPSAAPYTQSPVADYGAGGPNQIHIPVANREWAWEQIVDAVDDYFRIQRERQVQLVGDVLTEGRIDTFPLVGATIVEPHRHDSVGRYNRWESTFQTIRRRGTIRIIPDGTGYIVDVQVEKDIEDLPHPENSTAGAATFRNDSSLLSAQDEAVNPTRLGGNWILLGRDPALEQRILADIQARLSPQAGPQQVVQ